MWRLRSGLLVGVLQAATSINEIDPKLCAQTDFSVDHNCTAFRLNDDTNVELFRVHISRNFFGGPVIPLNDIAFGAPPPALRCRTLLNWLLQVLVMNLRAGAFLISAPLFRITHVAPCRFALYYLLLWGAFIMSQVAPPKHCNIDLLYGHTSRHSGTGYWFNRRSCLHDYICNRRVSRRKKSQLPLDCLSQCKLIPADQARPPW